MSNLLLSFYGDDFTGSTDAMESLTRSGLRTVLFASPPTRAQLERHPDLQAFGVAGMTRSMRPDEMERTLRPVFASLKSSGAPIVHYKVCSTFDSSPTVGSIGRVIDVGTEVFESRYVPVVVGAPALGRYCVFGNLFARCGTESEPYRLDRHPSMSKHPVTPMDEADLRLHLAKQTNQPIGLLSVLQLEQAVPERELDRLVDAGSKIVLIDLLNERQLATVGWLIQRHANQGKPLFVVGSSGVNTALGAHWEQTGVTKPRTFTPVGDVGPIVAICGSCSPVTAGQIRWAVSHGFDEVKDVEQATRSLNAGRSVVIHTGMGETDKRVAESAAKEIGPRLGATLREILATTKVRRVLVAGGDTSGSVASGIGIESMEMVGELTRGSPLCRVTAPNSPADGIEVTFKGGQIGPVDFFGRVKTGAS